MKHLQVHRKDLTACQVGEQARKVWRIDIDRQPEPVNGDPSHSVLEIMTHITRQGHPLTLPLHQSLKHQPDSVYADKLLNDKALAETGELGTVCYTSHTPLQPGRAQVTLNTLAMRW